MKTTAFGRYLKKKRADAGLSLREVSAASGISFVFLGEVERGVRPMIKRDRWPALEQAIPGFSVLEVERQTSHERGVQLSLEDAPPQYRNLGLTLARRIESRDLKDSQLDELLRILGAGTDEDV
jgi:transcriptional regulator with XRE-family HTH domain